MHDKHAWQSAQSMWAADTLNISSAATYCSGAMQCAGGLGGVLFAVLAGEGEGEALWGCPNEGEAWHGPSGGGSCLLTDYNNRSSHTPQCGVSQASVSVSAFYLFFCLSSRYRCL